MDLHFGQRFCLECGWCLPTRMPMPSSANFIKLFALNSQIQFEKITSKLLLPFLLFCCSQSGYGRHVCTLTVHIQCDMQTRESTDSYPHLVLPLLHLFLLLLRYRCHNRYWVNPILALQMSKNLCIYLIGWGTVKPQVLNQRAIFFIIENSLAFL